MLAGRIAEIGLSPTLRISALASELRAAGEDVLDFSAGQPDFPTPDPVKEAGRLAIEQNRTRYTVNQGIVELREAVTARLRDDHGVEYGPREILISPGAKASLYFAVLTLIDPGDEVLIPSPYWVSYPEQIRLAQGKPVYLSCSEEAGFKLDPATLAAAIGPRTRMLILNSPSNPTGACYRREELQPLVEACARHDVWVLADEIYGKLIFDGRAFTSVAEMGDAVRARTIVIGGMSKTYSMTGWRIGWAAGPAEVIDGMSRLQSHTTSNATSISQWASVTALQLPDEVIAARVAELQRRRDAVLEGLRRIPGIRCVTPEASFYAFPNVSGCFGAGLRNGTDVAELLLREARVAVVPGEAFGSESHVRLSYVLSLDRVQEGMARIASALGAAAGRSG